MPVFADNATDSPFVWDRCSSFDGGMVSFSKSSGLAENQASLLYDTNIHITGQVRKRHGVLDLKSPIGPIVSGKIIQGLKWFDTPLLDRLLAATNGMIYQYDQSTKSWSLFVDAEISNHDELISMAQLSDDLFWTDSTKGGLMVRDHTDGIVYEIIDSPKATILMSASLRLVAGGDPNAPNSLWFSDFLDGWTWPVLQVIGIGEDGDPITCFKKWQKYYIIVGKYQSIYMVDADPAYGKVISFPIYEVHASIGCVAKRSMCQVGQDMFFLSRNGVMRVTPQEATETNVLVPLPVSQPIQDIVNSIRWPFASRSCAVCYNNYYLLSVPVDSNEPDTVLVYSNITASWVGVWRNQSVLDFCEQPYQGATRLVMGYANGHVKEARDYVQENVELAVDFTDDGAPIETIIITRAMICGDDMSPKTPFYLEAEFFSKDGDIELYAILDGGDSILLEDGKFTLGSAIRLPFYLPVQLVKPKWVKKKFPLFHLGQFREIQIKVIGPSGNLVLRSLTLSAQLDSVNFNQQFEF